MKICKVSTIIPTCNRPEMLKISIDSVLNQTHPNIEIIIINDCNRDHLLYRLSYNKLSKGINFIQTKNLGPALARNLGFKHSTGEFIQFLDDDDWLLPDAIEKKVAVLQSEPDVGIVFSDLYISNEDGRLQGRFYGKYNPAPPGGDLYPKLIVKNFIPLHSMLWRRSVFEQTGGFPDLSHMEDWYCLLRAAESTKFQYLNEPLAVYRIHQQNRSSMFAQKKQAELAVQKFVADSPRFSTLEPGTRSYVLARYAWKEWVDGSTQTAKSYLTQAYQTGQVHIIAALVKLLMVFSPNVGRLLTRAVWRFRSIGARKQPLENHFLRRNP